ncbi:MAG: GNAT family N-acetyltransferase [bacterium]
MRLTRHESPAELLAAAEPYLRSTEAQNALIYGIVSKLAAGAELHPDPYLASLADAEGIPIGVAMLTPPFVMVVSAFPPAGQALLVEDLRRAGIAPSGVLGPEPDVLELAERWAAATGQRVTPAMRQRTYRLDRVQPVEVEGRLRPGEGDDGELVRTWTEGFAADLGIHGSEHLIPVSRHAFEGGGLFLWERAGQPVSMAALVGETPRGARIGFVYTPPQHRSRGYASACTAAVSQRYLDAGKRFCCLNADLANPASNRVYLRIGYRPVGDLREVTFTGPRAS